MAPISPSPSFLLPINHRGSFFEDVFFQDAREDFHHAIRDVLTRRDRGRRGDRSRDLSCYRKLRQEDDFDEDSQALTITEDENNRKILLDVKEFHPDGDVKVHAITDRELLVEGHQHDRKTGKALSFTRTFMLPWYADLSCGYFSVDISSDGVLRILTTKKAPSTGRSIPLVIECEAITEDEFNQESCVNDNNNNNSSRKVSMSTNSSHNESYNYTNSTTNNKTESVHYTSQQDTTREEQQNNKKGKIIPIVFVKNESNKESEKVSQNCSSKIESAASSNQNGSAQYSSNKRNTSSSPSSKDRLIKTVITTTFDVKSDSNQGIPAKQQEIVIPVRIDPNSSVQQNNIEKEAKQQQQQQPNRNTKVPEENSSLSNSTKQHEKVIPIKREPRSLDKNTNNEKDTKQQKSNRNTTGSNIKSSFPIPNLVNTNQKYEDSSSKNSKMKQTIPVTVEKKKDKTKDADTSKSKTPKIVCFNILNKKSKANTSSDKHKKDNTKDHKQRTHPKEFVIPLTVECQSSDEPCRKEAVKKVEIGKQDQNKISNGKKPPIIKNMKPKSPQPKKLIISSVFKGQEEQEKEFKRGRSSENKPPPVPRHERSSSIEDRVSVFTKMSPVAERKSRKDIMDEIRGNSRGARSRSRSIEELVSKFDKMSPQVERKILMRKNSKEEKTEFVEKKPVIEQKGTIIPIKLEYEENDDKSFVASISDVASSIDAMINQINNEHSLNDTPSKVDCMDTINKGFSPGTPKIDKINENEEKNSCTSTSDENGISESNSNNFITSCLSSESTSENYTKDDNENDSITSISSPSVIEDSNLMIFADEESQKKSKDKTKKSSKRKVKRKQSFPGVQVSDDETGETNLLLSGRSTSSSGIKKKSADINIGSLGDESYKVGKTYDGNERVANDSTDFSNENISKTKESSDEFSKETSSNIPEIANKNVPSVETLDENTENRKLREVSNVKPESRRSSVLPNPSDLLKIKPPKKNKKENTETTASSQNCNLELNENESTEASQSRRASVLPNPSDLLKIKLPKKIKKERTLNNESCENDNNESTEDQITDINQKKASDSRRTSVLPDPVDLLKIKPQKKTFDEQTTSTSKSIPPENSEKLKGSQDIQKPKEQISIESKLQQNKTDSLPSQICENAEKLNTKVDIVTEKVNDNKDLEKNPENSQNPETTDNKEKSTSNLDVPQTPSLRRKTSFKKYKVFENKRTPSPSPVRRPDTPATPKPEQILINKIEESSTPKIEETNSKKEEAPLIKDESSSSRKNSKINTCVTIENKDMFFSDPFFKDHRQLFMGGVREALKRSGITSMRDKLRVYRDLRLKGATEDNQAICSAEDETSYKAVLDMTEFLEGEIKVKTMSSTEIIIEAVGKAGDKAAPFTHSLPFPDSIKMEAVEASLSEDGILAINAPKTNPDTEV